MSFRSTRSVGFSTPSRGIVYRNSNVPAELPPDRFNRDSAYIRSWSTCSRQCRGSVLDERTFAFPFSSNYRKVSDRISFSQTQCGGTKVLSIHIPAQSILIFISIPSHPSTQNSNLFPNSTTGGLK